MFTPWHKLLSRRLSRGHRSRVPAREQRFRPRLEVLETRTLLNAGDLDPTFGAGGKVLTDFTGPIDAVAAATVMQPDGKIIVVGTGNLLARYNSDGNLDAGFGTGGRLSSESFAGRNGVTGVALQPDGKIVVVGDSQGNNVNSVLFAVARYTAGGQLDASFGTGGIVTTDLGGVSAATGVAVQPDGKIVVVGKTGELQPSSAAVVRYNGDGRLDTSFGTGGKVITAGASAAGILLQPDARIVVVGGSEVRRYNPDGSPDPLFGVGGKAMVNYGSALGLGLSGAVLQGDGKIVVVGTIPSYHGVIPSTPLMVRLNPNGSLDGNFGGSGQVTAAVTTNGVAIQFDGKIVLGGRNPPVFGSPPPEPVFAVARYNTDGSLDTGFGTGGKASVVIGSNETPAAVAVQSDGKIVAVGSAQDPKHTDFALLRLSPSGTVDSGFGTGGQVLTGFIGTVNSSATGVAVQADGKIIGAGTAGVNFALARYTADGNLDATFGTGGRVSTDIGQSSSSNFIRVGVAIQADGKIVVAGSGTQGGALLRYNADGSLDLTFGTAGQVTNNIDFVAGPLLQPDGKIVVLGRSLTRFNPDGSLDTSFGNRGSIPEVNALGVALQPDGKILVGSEGGPGVAFEVLTRYNPGGSLDLGFGAGGTVTSASPGTWGSPVFVQPDGKIVVGSLLRYNSDGSPDLLFGTNGQTILGFPAGSFVLLPDGRIAVGFSTTLAIYKPNGTPDVRFGNASRVTLDLTLAALGFQPDGKIVTTGTTGAGGHTSFTVARYLTTGGLSLSPNQLFVAQVYPDLLRRPVDPGGLTFWAGLLDRGASRAQVVQGIQNSAEYLGIEVNSLYRAVLGRYPESAGLSAWVGFLGRGGTAEQLEALLLGSDEFFLTHGSDNSKGFLPALYQIVLQRPIDPGGAQAWGQALQSGALSRTAVAAAILASLESDRLEVQALYRQLLHRDADAGGLDAFANALQRGVNNELVGIALISSAEYFSRV